MLTWLELPSTQRRACLLILICRRGLSSKCPRDVVRASFSVSKQAESQRGTFKMPGSRSWRLATQWLPKSKPTPHTSKTPATLVSPGMLSAINASFTRSLISLRPFLIRGRVHGGGSATTTEPPRRRLIFMHMNHNTQLLLTDKIFFSFSNIHSQERTEDRLPAF